MHMFMHHEPSRAVFHICNVQHKRARGTGSSIETEKARFVAVAVPVILLIRCDATGSGFIHKGRTTNGVASSGERHYLFFGGSQLSRA